MEINDFGSYKKLPSSYSDENFNQTLSENLRFIRELQLASEGTRILKFSGNLVNLDSFPEQINSKSIRNNLLKLTNLEIIGNISNCFNDLNLKLEVFCLSGEISNSFNRFIICASSLTISDYAFQSFNRSTFKSDKLIIRSNSQESFNQINIHTNTLSGTFNECVDSYNQTHQSVINDCELQINRLENSWNQGQLQMGNFNLITQQMKLGLNYGVIYIQGDFELIGSNISDCLNQTNLILEAFKLNVDCGDQLANFRFKLIGKHSEIIGNYTQSFQQSIFNIQGVLKIMGNQKACFNQNKISVNELYVSSESRSSFNQNLIVANDFNYLGTETSDCLVSGTIQLANNFIYQKQLILESVEENFWQIYVWAKNLWIEIPTQKSTPKLINQSTPKLINQSNPNSTQKSTQKLKSHQTPDNQNQGNLIPIFQNAVLNIKKSVNINSFRPIFKNYSLETKNCWILTPIKNSFNQGDLHIYNQLIVNDIIDCFLDSQIWAQEIEIQGTTINSFNNVNLVGSTISANSNELIQDSLSETQIDLSGVLTLSGSTKNLLNHSLIKTKEFNINGDVIGGWSETCAQISNFNLTGELSGTGWNNTFVQSKNFAIKSGFNLITSDSKYSPLSLSVKHLYLPDKFRSEQIILTRNLSHLDLHSDLIPGIFQSKLKSCRLYSSNISEVTSEILIIEPNVNLRKIQPYLYHAKQIIFKGPVEAGELSGINLELIERLEILDSISGKIFYGLEFPKLTKLILTNPDSDCFPNCKFPQLNELTIKNCITLSLVARPLIINAINSIARLSNIKSPKILILENSLINGFNWKSNQSYNNYQTPKIRIMRKSWIKISRLIEINGYHLSLIRANNCYLKSNRIYFPNTGRAQIYWGFKNQIIIQKIYVV